MKIGIDARLWNQTGVGRYIRNLVLNLEKIDKKNNYVLFVRSVDLEEIKKEIRNPNWVFVKTDLKWHSFSEQINFPKIIKKENVSLMHFPYFSVPVFYKGPFVVTVHDLILHHFATGEASTLPYWLYGFKMLSYRIVINSAAKKACKIIAVSDATKEEIFDHLMVGKSKVEVIHEAADDFKNSSAKKPDFKNYFLFVGNTYPHKNVRNLLKAFEILIRENKDVKLVFVARRDVFYKRLQKQVKKFGENVVFVNNADDNELTGLYQNAICLIRPSFMEGFSLPPLEALSHNCLPLVSDIPVHREILKDAAIYFDPGSTSDIADKMSYVLQMSDNAKNELLSKGKKVTGEYSWEETARKTLKLYESCLSI